MDTTPPSLLMRVRDPADHVAWAEFDRRYRYWLIRFFRRRGVRHIDAEDLTQRVFSGLLKGLPQFVYDRKRGSFRGYLFRCAQHVLSAWATCPDHRHRPLDRRVDLGDSGNGDSDPAAAKIWEEEWVAHHFRLAFATLRADASPRDLLILERSLAGIDIHALAGEFAMEEQAVYKARQRIRRRLEQLIAAQVAEEDQME